MLIIAGRDESQPTLSNVNNQQFAQTSIHIDSQTATKDQDLTGHVTRHDMLDSRMRGVFVRGTDPFRLFSDLDRQCELVGNGAKPTPGFVPVDMFDFGDGIGMVRLDHGGIDDCLVGTTTHQERVYIKGPLNKVLAHAP